jgi:hypothetical protein
MKDIINRLGFHEGMQLENMASAASKIQQELNFRLCLCPFIIFNNTEKTEVVFLRRKVPRKRSLR